MVKLLIIADDFTGALDTAVHFATCGAKVKVVVNNAYAIDDIEDTVEVLVMDIESRHIKKEEAYHIVSSIVKKACKIGIPYIYKKTDSALRGNIGSELAAVLESADENILHFLPAFPKMNRMTKQGIQYIETVRVHESVFGKDPYEPVKFSYIPDIIGQQTAIPVQVVGEGEKCFGTDKKCIAIYDATTDKELEDIVSLLKSQGKLHIMAGCSGLASVLPKVLGLPYLQKNREIRFKQHFLIVCGSVNGITRKQLDYAEEKGFKRIRLTPQQKLEKGYFKTEQGKKDLNKWAKICKENKKCIIDSNDVLSNNETLDYAKIQKMNREEIRMTISDTIGNILHKLIEKGIESTLLLTGGDTLLAFMNQLGVDEIEPICEIESGIVLSRFMMEGKVHQVLSKSGGFGEEKLLPHLASRILAEKAEGDCDEFYDESTQSSIQRRKCNREHQDSS